MLWSLRTKPKSRISMTLRARPLARKQRRGGGWEDFLNKVWVRPPLSEACSQRVRLDGCVGQHLQGPGLRAGARP